MIVNCCMCLDILSPSDELSSAPCGHVFHYICILQWFEKGKNNCPQCRTICRNNQLRRIFFTEGKEEGPKDVGMLRNQVDSLTFNNRMLEKEKKALKEEAEALKAQNTALREEFRSLERENLKLKENVSDAKTQLRYVQGEQAKFKEAKREAEDLRSKLELYKTIDLVVKGSVAEVNNKLHEIGDFSKTSRDLSYILISLKRELENERNERILFRSEVKKKDKEMAKLKAELRVKDRGLDELRQANKGLNSDLRHSDEENAALKAKIKHLQEAIDSPSGDPRGSALSRLVSEYPQPMSVVDEDGSELRDQISSSASPFLPTKTCNIVGLQRNEHINGFKDFNILKKSRVNGNGIFSMPLSKLKSFNDVGGEKFYNGLGGHEKLESFPVAKKDPFKVKVPSRKPPKGVSRPKKPVPSSSSQNIDKYFSLETP